MTNVQRVWLEDKEKCRDQFSLNYAENLVVRRLSKGKTDEKDPKKEKKGNKTKDSKASKGKNKDENRTKTFQPKYRSASDFMVRNFLNFECNEKEDDEFELGTHSPMRVVQNYEYDRIVENFNRFDVDIEDKLKNALLIPESTCEAVSLEQLRVSSLEGLMTNPIRKDLWRTYLKKAGKIRGKRKR
jgi:hypothetical protein